MAFVDPVRHCQTCVSLSKTEEEFFTEHIKVLVGGAPFHVTTSSTTSTPTTPESPAITEELSLASDVPQLVYCSVTSDHRNVIFQLHDKEYNLEEAKIPDPIEIAKILEYHTVQDEKQQLDTLKLRVKINAFEEAMIKLESPPEPSRKPSVLWLAALCKGLEMIIQPRES